MRFVALLLLAVASAQQQILFSFSGNFTTTRQKLKASAIDEYGTCSLASAQTFYTTFNYTFTSAGVRGVYGANLLFVGVSQDMSGFLASDLCANTTAVYPLSQTSLGYTGGTGPDYAFGGWFEAQMYTFVIAGNDGPFVGEIREAQIKGSITGANSWEPVYSDNGNTQCYDAGTQSFFDAQLYTATRTGFHSLFLAFGQNKTALAGYQLPYNYPTLSVLKGNYIGSVNPFLKCATVGANYTLGRRSTAKSLNVQVYNAYLTAGATYTIVATSGDTYQGDGFIGNYGVSIFEGTQYNFSATNDVFDRPQSDSCTVPSQCVAAFGETGNNYARVTFSVPKNSFYWIYSEGSTGFLWYFYNENNVNKSTCGSNFNCFNVEYILGGKFYFSGNSENFTIYVTGQADQAVLSEGAINIYISSGPSLTAVPSLAPTAAPTVAPTAAPSTHQPTTAGTTYEPTTKQPSAAPSTRQPTTAGTTYAPTSKQPTVAGTTLEPTSKQPTAAGPEVSSAMAASMALSLCIGMLVLA